MSLETGTRIQDMVSTNPVGATDFASQGDDHIRLIKACVQGSFPSLGAGQVTATAEELSIMDGVTATAAELNALDGITATVAELNILDGVTLTAAQINDAARKSAANTFSADQTMGANLLADGNGTRSIGATGARFAGVWSVNLNGIVVTDFARLSQQNVFASNIGIGGRAPFSASTFLRMQSAANDDAGIEFGRDSSTVVFMQAYDRANAIYSTLDIYAAAWRLKDAGGNVRSSLDSSGNFNASSSLSAGGVNARSLPLITSTSTTLVKGQLHHISGNATLPALGDGEWICLVNNSGSTITITEHSGDTTYYTSYGVAVSTVDVPARGRLFASGAGSSVVYVSGDISGYT